MVFYGGDFLVNFIVECTVFKCFMNSKSESIA